MVAIDISGHSREGKSLCHSRINSYPIRHFLSGLRYNNSFGIDFIYVLISVTFCIMIFSWQPAAETISYFCAVSLETKMMSVLTLKKAALSACLLYSRFL